METISQEVQTKNERDELREAHDESDIWLELKALSDMILVTTVATTGEAQPNHEQIGSQLIAMQDHLDNAIRRYEAGRERFMECMRKHFPRQEGQVITVSPEERLKKLHWRASQIHREIEITLRQMTE